MKPAPLVLLAVIGFALAGCTRSSGNSATARRPYALMQMNLCLSGLAGCFAKVDYPAGVYDVVAQIRAARPAAVTLNEACSGDVALIARRTGYHARFSTVIYHARALACIHPGGRGIFGDAVLTQAAIVSAESQPFRGQAGPERRAWLCVTTRADIDVCTAHLASPEPDEIAANGPQCAELKAVLAARASTRPVIFGGDVNRLASCAPAGFWTRTDASARQDPGSQHVYGSARMRAGSARALPAPHTDHDTLLVHAYEREH